MLCFCVLRAARSSVSHLRISHIIRVLVVCLVVLPQVKDNVVHAVAGSVWSTLPGSGVVAVHAQALARGYKADGMVVRGAEAGTRRLLKRYNEAQQGACVRSVRGCMCFRTWMWMCVLPCMYFRKWMCVCVRACACMRACTSVHGCVRA